MKILLRLWHELETLRSWLFDGEPHIDGHLWRNKGIKKVGDRYYCIEECECGKTDDRGWMNEMTYLQHKDEFPPLKKAL